MSSASAGGPWRVGRRRSLWKPLVRIDLSASPGFREGHRESMLSAAGIDAGTGEFHRPVAVHVVPGLRNHKSSLKRSPALHLFIVRVQLVLGDVGRRVLDALIDPAIGQVCHVALRKEPLRRGMPQDRVPLVKRPTPAGQ